MPRESVKEYGPWRGCIEQPAKCGPNALEDCFNVEISKGRLRKRQGRKLQFLGDLATPARVVFANTDNAGNYIAATDFTAALTDGNPSTFLDATSVNWQDDGGANISELLVGFSAPFHSLQFQFATVNPNNFANTLLFVHYWNGTSYVLASLIDGTAVSTITFKQNGWVTIGASGGAGPWPPADWQPEAINIGGIRTPPLYWARFEFASVGHTNALNGTQISDILIDLSGAKAPASNPGLFSGETLPDQRQSINGIMYYTMPSGERQIIVGADDTANGRPKLYQWVLPGNWFRTISLPPTARTEPGSYWRAVMYSGKLVITNGAGPLMIYDGVTCDPLIGLQGSDSSVRAYINPPLGKYLAVYNSALYVGALDGAPRTVAISEYANATNIFTSVEAEKLGGANYWPAGNDFDASSGDSTFPETSEITGLAVLAGRLLVLTRERPYLYDDSPLLEALGGNAGCVASNTLQTNGNDAYWLGDRKVWRMRKMGNRFSTNMMIPVEITSIGDAIEPTLREVMNPQAIAGAIAYISPEKHQYRLEIPIGPSSRNRLCLVYDFENEHWVKWGGYAPWMDQKSVDNGPLALPGSTFANHYETEIKIAPREIAAACRVSDPGEFETIITGDYNGWIWLEDDGTSDDMAIFDDPTGTTLPVRDMFAYGVTHRIALGDELVVRQFREWRAVVAMKGQANFNAFYVYDGEEAGGALNADLQEPQGREYVIELSGGGLRPSPEDEPWFTTDGIGTVDPGSHRPTIGVPVTIPLTRRYPADEYRQFIFPLPQTGPDAGTANNGVQLTAQVAGQAERPTARVIFFSTRAAEEFDIRGWETDFDVSRSAR